MSLVPVGDVKNLSSGCGSSGLFRNAVDESQSELPESALGIAVFDASEKQMKTLKKEFKAWAGKDSSRMLHEQ